MNIGNWIFISFILFAAFMAALVTVCLRQDVSLVSKDYYNEELQFQQQIQRQHNTNMLLRKPSIDLQEKVLTLVLNQAAPIHDGYVKVFCPSNSLMDRTFAISPESETQSFDLNELSAGMYRVKVRWTMDNKEFYQEEVINL